jgi:HSP20 family protein
MANIMKRNESAPLSTSTDWDPFRTMRELMRWDPFREMSPLFGRGERMLEFVPQFEVKETPDAFVFKADMPGVRDEDIDITLTGNRLTIAGRREAEQQEQSDTFYTYERSYGSFSRVFTLPDGIDQEHIRSELKHGVLTLVVPKKAEAQPRKITVGSSTPTTTSTGGGKQTQQKQ